MKYEKTGSKINKDTAHGVRDYNLNAFDSRDMLTALIKRHKFGLSVALNITFAIYFFLPFLPGEIVNLVSSL